MPKVKPEYQEERREQILGAALACFARRGFHKSSMQDIVAESGLSPGSIYLYFKSKDEIIRAAADARHEEERRLFAAAFAGGGGREAFGALSRHFFSSLFDAGVLRERSLDVQLWGEAMVNPEVLDVVRGGFEETRNILAGQVALLQQGGKVPARLAPKSVASVMLALFQGFVLQRMTDDTLNVEEFMSVMQSLADSGFGWTEEKSR